MIDDHKVLSLSVFAVMLSACTTLPKAPSEVLAQPNVPLVQSYPVGHVDYETRSDALMPSIAATGWREFYDDQKLIALIELGLKNNKSFTQQVLAMQRYRAQYRISTADSIPQVGASASASRGASHQADRNPSDSYSVGLASSSYELDFWGRVANLKEVALHQYLASAAAKDAAQIALIADIANTYVNISFAKAQVQLAQSTVESRERSLYITQRRFGAGIDSRSPSLQAEASLESARLALLGAQTSLQKAQNALELLIGSPVPDELMPDVAVTGIISTKVFNTGLPSELLYYRPDIAQAEHALKAAGANINVARAAYFPKISLSGSVGIGSRELGDLFSTNGITWSFGPNISLPIFDAGQRRANYDVATISQQEALAGYELAIQTAFKEVKDVLAERATLAEQLSAQYRLQENFQRTYDIAYATYRTGLSNYLDVLDAERSLFANQQSILSLEQQRVMSQIALYKVLGGGASLSAPLVAGVQAQNDAMTSARLATMDEVYAKQAQIGVPVVGGNVPSVGRHDAAQSEDSQVPSQTQVPQAQLQNQSQSQLQSVAQDPAQTPHGTAGGAGVSGGVTRTIKARVPDQSSAP